MDGYSEWWFSRFSDDWQDLTTPRGFVGGVLSIIGNLIVFVLLIVLAQLLGIIPPELGESSSAFRILLFPVMLVSILAGGGWFYLFQKSNRIKQLSKMFSGRTLFQVAIYGGFWLLLLLDVGLSIWVGMAFVFGKSISLLGIFINDRL